MPPTTEPRPVDHDDVVTYPNFAGKHERAALFGPDEFLAHLHEQGGLHPEAVPESFIMCYERRLFDALERSPQRRPVAHRNRRYFALGDGGQAVGIAGGFGIGAPASAVVLEELVALGARRFISIGLAGTLAPNLSVGDIVVCTNAVRDEGVSHHYAPPGRSAEPSPTLTRRLEECLREAGLPFASGPTWTIDTPYRETVDEVRHYQAEGVLTVEMEAAALFTVGRYRGVEVAAAFVISDRLTDERWHGQFHDAIDPLRKLYDASLSAFNTA
jgi:uridine phosphorylase